MKCQTILLMMILLVLSQFSPVLAVEQGDNTEVIKSNLVIGGNLTVDANNAQANYVLTTLDDTGLASWQPVSFTGVAIDASTLGGEIPSYYLDNTDSQTLGLAGSILTISGGNNVDLSTIEVDFLSDGATITNATVTGVLNFTDGASISANNVLNVDKLNVTNTLDVSGDFNAELDRLVADDGPDGATESNPSLFVHSGGNIGIGTGLNEPKAKLDIETAEYSTIGVANVPGHRVVSIAPSALASDQAVTYQEAVTLDITGKPYTLDPNDTNIEFQNRYAVKVTGGAFIQGTVDVGTLENVTLRLGGGGIKTGGDMITGDASGFGVIPKTDSFRIRRDNNFFNTGEDATIFEKTDSNSITGYPDGGIAFVNTAANTDGTAANTTTAMVIKGTGKVGIGTIDPGYKLEVVGDVKADHFIGNFDGSLAGVSFENIPASAIDGTFVQSLNDLSDANVTGAALSTSVYIGADAGATATGDANTALGKSALTEVSGASNVAIGAFAGAGMQSGSNNTLVGVGVAANIGSGNNNTVIGSVAGSNITSGENNIIIGASVVAPIADADNQINIGNLYYGKDGDAGIGVIDPQAKLHVGGDMIVEGEIRANGGIVIRGSLAEALDGMATGLIIQSNSSNPDTQLDVIADTIIMRDAISGDSTTLSSVSFTVDISKIGLNGLHSGFETPSTWYNIWAISDATRNVAGLLSEASAGPIVLPAGYVNKAYLGSVFNDSSSDLVQFYQAGKVATVEPRNALFNGISTNHVNYAAIDLTDFIPPNASRVIADAGMSKTSYLWTRQGGYFRPKQSSTIGEQSLINYVEAVGGYSDKDGEITWPLMMPIMDQQTVYYRCFNVRGDDRCNLSPPSPSGGDNGGGTAILFRVTGWELR